MIVPTVGRVVWFWPMYAAITPEFSFITGPGGPQPCAATVAYVFRNDLVNLSVTDHNGRQHHMGSVPLVQENEPKPEAGYFCQWMPYQIKMAEKEKL